MPSVVATVSQVKQYMNSTNHQTSVNYDEVIRQMCIGVTDAIEQKIGHYFVPRRETRFYTNNDVGFPGWDRSVCTETLYLNGRIVEVFQLTTNNGASIIDGANFSLRTAMGYNRSPFTEIELATNQFFACTDDVKPHSVDGLWIDHDRPAKMWRLADSVQDNPLLVSSTTANVSNAQNFEALQTVRFGDDNTGEFAIIDAIDVDNNKIIIDRGENGTTAVEQPLNTNIYVFQPRHELAELVARTYIAYQYRRRDNAGGLDDRTLLSNTGSILMSAVVLPGEVSEFLSRYRDQM